MGIELHLYTCPFSGKDSRAREALNAQGKQFILHTLSFSVWNFFALCFAKSWRAAGIPGFFPRGTQE